VTPHDVQLYTVVMVRPFTTVSRLTVLRAHAGHRKAILRSLLGFRMVTYAARDERAAMAAFLLTDRSCEDAIHARRANAAGRPAVFGVANVCAITLRSPYGLPRERARSCARFASSGACPHG